MARAIELTAMRRAIAISAHGLGSTSPNPPVGCVILDSAGRTVGEGYHVRKGDSHAETNALAAAGNQARGGTAVVTLEPCNHYGRTPPCREALINANIARVLIAVMDPTSRGDGGAALLRRAGVEVECGFLQDEALLVLGPWLASLKNSRPFITWLYEADQHGLPVRGMSQSPVQEALPFLRRSHDLIIAEDGEIEEGRRKSHGDGVFQVPLLSPCEKSAETISKLIATGARSALIVGASDRTAMFSAAGVVDRIIAYLPLTPHSWTADDPKGFFAAVPDGYRLTAVCRHGNYVRLVGAKD
ncbi:bifunctional diaminohydroxyphosphoribosylaminopyrimidine deaminase/5-amino-6-(5-phosphoribosylamino)uracil reductase RibD [Streptomyces sp. NPDC056161]|uniref:bifunctional diaminohydroxyphosphoribosylaminopyrimidine deaminase/5-amino-6-(5-phosphoribosylamino)uracil reductase RibD n=1 Tax=Streptomyces sp. NPDC056161 TaxID=3345732 RepID=UPI0035D9D3C7